VSGATADKCIWCHEADGELTTITVTTTDRLGRNPDEDSVAVHPHHAPQTRAFCRFAARNGKTFVGVMVAGTIVAVALGLLVTTLLADIGPGEDYWIGILYGAYAVLAGFFIVRFPLATPETVKWIGIAKAKLLAQASGWLTAGIGVWLFTSAIL